MGLPSILRTCSIGMPGSTLEKLCGFNTCRSALILPSGPSVIM